MVRRSLNCALFLVVLLTSVLNSEPLVSSSLDKGSDDERDAEDRLPSEL